MFSWFKKKAKAGTENKTLTIEWVIRGALSNYFSRHVFDKLKGHHYVEFYPVRNGKLEYAVWRKDVRGDIDISHLTSIKLTEENLESVCKQINDLKPIFEQCVLSVASNA